MYKPYLYYYGLMGSINVAFLIKGSRYGYYLKDKISAIFNLILAA